MKRMIINWNFNHYSNKINRMHVKIDSTNQLAKDRIDQRLVIMYIYKY